MRKPLLLGLSLLGLFDSLYLLWIYTSPSRPMVCIGSGCDVVRASAYSHLWGVPLPAFGVLMYVVLALLIFAEPLLPAGLGGASRTLVAGIAGAGFLFSLYLTYLQAFVIHAWCAWCDTSALVVTFIFALAVLELARPAPQPEPAVSLARVRRQFILCVMALVVGAPAFLFLSSRGGLPPTSRASMATLQERLVRPDSHMTGNPQSPVSVVEFGDFECLACGRAEEAAREIRAKYGHQIRFVFRQFPLARIHPQALKAAEASECAAEQGEFWEAVEKLYAGHGDLSESALKRYAMELGLDPSRFNLCLSSGSAAARIQRDADDGRALGVRATPTFFVGSRMIEGPLPVADFSQLLDQELARHGLAMAPFTMPTANPTSNPPANRPSSPKAQARVSPPPTALSQNPSPASTGFLGTGGGGIFSKFQTSATACSEEEAAKQQAPLIQTSEARQLHASSAKPLFVDVRPAKDFSSGRIPGAINLPVDNIEQQWSSLPQDRVIVLYESGLSPGDVCAYSRAAGRALLTHGFSPERVKVYQEGLAGWQKVGLPVEH
jgi:protein-disulfide isomerase/uncharacterized membrane protein/rhodanese-related sulfurtransferase